MAFRMILYFFNCPTLCRRYSFVLFFDILKLKVKIQNFFTSIPNTTNCLSNQIFFKLRALLGIISCLTPPGMGGVSSSALKWKKILPLIKWVSWNLHISLSKTSRYILIIKNILKKTGELQKIRNFHRPWSSRIDYFENICSCSYLEPVSKKSNIFQIVHAIFQNNKL